jgi:Uracil DNA glycosylase superfamily
MRDSSFRQAQKAGIYLPNVQPINALVDELGAGGWVPYVAPIYGGIDAEMLSILESPRPMTDSSAQGSGFLCQENNDPTAALFAVLLEEAGIPVNKLVAWNACPWLTAKKKLSTAEREAGIEPLRRLLALLPRLRVVMLNGGEAKKSWQIFKTRYPTIASRYDVLPTYHTSRTAFQALEQERDGRMEDLLTNFRAAARILESAGA